MIGTHEIDRLLAIAGAKREYGACISLGVNMLDFSVVASVTLCDDLA